MGSFMSGAKKFSKRICISITHIARIATSRYCIGLFCKRESITFLVLEINSFKRDFTINLPPFIGCDKSISQPMKIVKIRK